MLAQGVTPKEPIATTANEAPKETKNELLTAIEKVDVKKVKELLKEPDFFKYSYKDSDGNTPLHYVGKIKDEKLRHALARALINAGMDIEFCNYAGEKPENYQSFEEIKKSRNDRLLNDFANWILIKPSFRGQGVKILTTFILLMCVAVLIPEYAFTYCAISVLRLLVGALVRRDDKIFLQKCHAQQVEADFFRAIVDNKLDTVKLVKYIEQGVNIHHLTNFVPNIGALAKAASLNYLEQVKFLLPFAKRTDFLDVIHESHLINEATMSYIFSKVSKDELGYMLLESIFLKNDKMVKFMLEKGAFVSHFHLMYANAHKDTSAKVIALLKDALAKDNANREASKPQPIIGVAKVITPHFEEKQDAANKDVKPKAETLKEPRQAPRANIG